jgi:hypothetical protein
MHPASSHNALRPRVTRRSCHNCDSGAVTNELARTSPPKVVDSRVAIGRLVGEGLDQELAAGTDGALREAAAGRRQLGSAVLAGHEPAAAELVDHRGDALDGNAVLLGEHAGAGEAMVVDPHQRPGRPG